MVKLFLRPMKICGYLLLFLIVAGLGAISCSDEEVQAEGIEPFIEVTFINASSLSKISIEIADIDAQITAINARITEIDAAENKAELLEEKDSLNAEKKVLNEERSELNSTASLITSGRVNLRELRGSLSAGVIENNPFDSTSVKRFPLNSGATNARFFTLLTVGDESFRVDTIDFTYKVVTEYKENQVRAIASQLDTAFHSFDSLKLKCKDSTCISNEALLTIYF